jgi:hypothetical protein
MRMAKSANGALKVQLNMYNIISTIYNTVLMYVITLIHIPYNYLRQVIIILDNM